MSITYQQHLKVILRLSQRQKGDYIDRAVMPAAKVLVSNIKERIKKKGLKSDGTRIGVYSEAYKLKRQALGLPASFVNISYSGQLLKAFKANKRFGGVDIGFTSAKEAQKREWNEKRFGRIFSATKEELAEYGRMVADASAKLAREQ